MNRFPKFGYLCVLSFRCCAVSHARTPRPSYHAPSWVRAFAGLGWEALPVPAHGPGCMHGAHLQDGQWGLAAVWDPSWSSAETPSFQHGGGTQDTVLKGLGSGLSLYRTHGSVRLADVYNEQRFIRS